MPRPAPHPDAAALLAHASWLRRLARELTADAASADDLAQDTYLAALTSDPSRERSLRPWLTAVARNLARLRARGARHRSDREQLAARAESLPASSEVVERAELQRLVVDLVLALREPYRSTLLLRFYEGFEPAQIARRQQIPASTVRSRLKRGIDLLRAALDERARGGRRAWCAMLAPLAGARGAANATWIGGVLVKSWTAATVIALATAAAFFAWRSYDAPQTSTREPDAPALTASAPTTSSPPPPHPSPDALDAPPLERRSIDPTPAPTPLSAFVEGILLDATTGHALADYALTLKRDTSVEALRTDASGRFRSAVEHPQAELLLELGELRHPSDLVQVRRADAEALRSSVPLTHAPPFAPHELRVATGPTLRFVLSPAPPDIASRSLIATLTCADRSQAFDRAHAPVRVGELPWARFGATARLLSGGPPWRAAVRSDEGFYSGDAELADLDEACALPIPIELRACARVFGRVLDASGAPVASQWVLLSGAGAAWSSGAKRPLATPTGADGRFEQRWIAPGRYALSVEREGFLPWRADLELEAERASEVDVALAARPVDPNAFLRGTVRSASGRYLGAFAVRALPARDSPTSKRADVALSEEHGEFVGRFAFENLDACEHDLELETPDLFLIDPPRITSRPGVDTLEFRVDDSLPTRAITVRAADAATGAPIERFLVLATVAPDQALERARQVVGRAGEARLEGVPQGLALELRVRADGYAPEWIELDAAADASAIDAKLAAGWGVDVRALAVAGLPLAGVAIAFDGEPAGQTDERGRLRATRVTTPSTLQAVYGDWVQAPASGVDPASGRFRAWEPTLRVVLVPP